MNWLQDDARLWIALATGIYGIAFAFAGISLAQQRRYLRPILFILILGAWFFQTVGLTIRGYEVQACPLGNPFEILQFITWTMVGLYVLVFPFYRINLLGFFTTSLAFGLGTLALFFPGWDHPYEEALFGGNPWVELHAALAISSYGVFGLLSLIAIMYLIQQYGLKSKHTNPFFRFLPSIYELDQVGMRLLSTGLIIFSIAILVGSLYWIPNFDNVSPFKLTATLLLWGAYLTAWFLRLRRRLVSRNFAWTCMTLFCLALLSLWPVDSSRNHPELSNPPASMEVERP